MVGYLASTSVRQSATAAALALAVWLVLVLIYDLGLLGVLVVDAAGLISKELFAALLLANPADSYRLLNLTGLADVELASGMGGALRQLGLPVAAPFAVLALWIAGPLILAALRLGRREL
jgi:Cu-processing system permease protein